MNCRKTQTIACYTSLVFICLLTASGSRKLYADDWDLLAAECERLLEDKKGGLAEQVAGKCLSTADTEVERCRSSILSLRASLLTRKMNAAEVEAHAVLESLALSCGYSQARNNLDFVAERVVRRKRLNDPSTPEADRLADLSAEALDKAGGGEMTQSQAALWLLMPAALKANGDVRLAKGDPDEAEPFFREAMTLHQYFNGKSVAYAQSCVDLAQAYATGGNYPLAVPLLEEAAGIFEREGQSVAVCNVSVLLADSLEKSGAAERAAAIREKVRKAQQDVSGVTMGVVVAVCMLACSFFWVIHRHGRKSFSPEKPVVVSASVVIPEHHRLTYEDGKAVPPTRIE